MARHDKSKTWYTCDVCECDPIYRECLEREGTDDEE